MADNAKTSKPVASKASKVLVSKTESPTCKSIAGSALAQTPYRARYIGAHEQKPKRRYYGE